MLQIQENVSLRNLNTFGVEARARYFVEINQEQDLLELYADERWKNVKRLVLGGGSNMLFVDDFEGLVIRINIHGINYQLHERNVYVEAAAGEVWNDFVQYCVRLGFAGVENLSLIPGSVGAAPVQNIGAYGVELKDVFFSCKAFHLQSGTFKVFEHQDCGFGYRESVFKGELKNQYIITSVKFLLSGSPNINISYGAIAEELNRQGVTHPGIRDVSDTVSRIRVSKLPDPSTIGNAGSFFKNPVVSQTFFKSLFARFPQLVNYPLLSGEVKLAAGWLIEQCGWKGKIVGNAGVWKNQALVLVNHGGASGKELYNLSSQIIDSVYEKFGIELEREVNIIR